MDEDRVVLPRVRCSKCNSMFYADEEDMLRQKEIREKNGEQFYCSYCAPYIRNCACCDKDYHSRQIFKNDSVTVCQGCRERYKISSAGGFTNGFSVLRFLTFSRDEFTCKYCGRTPLEDKVKLQCDHIVPVSRGGKDVLSNLITACEDCNQGKTDSMLVKSLITKLQQRKMRERYDGE